MKADDNRYDFILVREATLQDRKEIWKWWNDPDTREMMKKTEYEPWNTHCHWFQEVMENPNVILCVGLIGESKIGNVRFDCIVEDTSVYDVSINMNPSFRNKGMGYRFLTKAIQFLKKQRKPQKFFATVKDINFRSKRTFEKAGFECKTPEIIYSRIQDRYDPASECYYELSHSGEKEI